jgi:type IV pilus assembly protein PilV
LQQLTSRCRGGRQSGVSLVEVLVSILLMSLGLIAMVGLQAYAIASNAGAIHQTLAVAIAEEMAELLRANPAALATGAYTWAPTLGPADLSPARGVSTLLQPSIRCTYPDCDPRQLASLDLQTALVRTRTILPGGNLRIQPDAANANQADLWVVWIEPALDTAVLGTIAPAQNAVASDGCPTDLSGLNPRPRCVYMRVTL